MQGQSESADRESPPLPTMIDEQGGLRARRVGARRAWSRDAYHFLSTVSWFWLLSLLTGLFIVTNALFGLLYWLRPGCIANIEGSFLDCFFFSVQTILTIGYGAWYPVDAYANTLAAVEAFSGLLFTAVCTGIMFAKFSRPSARVRFSKRWIWRMIGEQRAFVIRMANERSTSIVDAQIRLHLALDEPTVDGTSFRRVYDLKLRRNHTPLFALSFTAVHFVDEHSPLKGQTLEGLAERNAMFLVAMTGTDERLMQTVYARHAYWVNDVIENVRFADVIHPDEYGRPVVDHRRFDEFIKLS